MMKRLGVLCATGVLTVTLASTGNAGYDDDDDDDGGDDDVVAIGFVAESCFNADFSEYPYVTFLGPDTLDLTPYGESHLEWAITVLATPSGFEFVDGWFSWTIPNGAHKNKKKKHKKKDDVSTLYGSYTGFELDPITGDYTLDWAYLGGTGKLEDAVGSGQTVGNADLTTLCAEYAFQGTLQTDD